MPKWNDKSISFHVPRDTPADARVLLEALRVTHAGYFRQQADHRIARKAGDIHESVLMYCVAGSGYAWVEEQRSAVNVGDMVLCHIDKPHGYGSDEDNPWTIYWLHITGTGHLDLARQGGFDLSHPVLRTSGQLSLSEFFRSIISTYKDDMTAAHQLRCSGILQQLMTQLHFDTQPQAPSSKLADDMATWMKANLNTPAELDTLMQRVTCSKAHFIREFKSRLGYSPVDYWIRLKVQWASQQLQNTDDSIGHIAHAIGYDDQYYFSRLFKKLMGESPRAYRKRWRA